MPEYNSYDSTVYDGGEASHAKLVISPVKMLKGHSNRAHSGQMQRAPRYCLKSLQNGGVESRKELIAREHLLG
jgi:hypothetical protein